MTHENQGRKPKNQQLKTKKTNIVSSSGVNYFGSVLPFLSAAQQGFMGEVQVLSSRTTVETDQVLPGDNFAQRFTFEKFV